MTMKYALVLAAAWAVPAVAQNVAHDTQWDDWIWCCEDSDGLCPDACARVNTEEGYWYETYGPGSELYIEQSEGKALAPTMTLPPGGFFDPDFIQAKCVMIHGFKCCGGSGVCGDPHFKTWAGDYYDYQGQCELKFVSAPDFGNGVGLDIHIRTKVSAVAVLDQSCFLAVFRGIPCTNSSHFASSLS